MALLEVKNLQTTFFTAAGEVRAVSDVSFSLDRGKVLGIVGESGSGKSVTAYSIIQIVTHPVLIVVGSVIYDCEYLVGASHFLLIYILGNKIIIIF